MGQPDPGNSGSFRHEYIVAESERGEVKHLSTPRKINQFEIPLVVASERGNSPNRRKQFCRGCGAALGCSPGS
jgi:hypothetical protein